MSPGPPRRFTRLGLLTALLLSGCGAGPPARSTDADHDGVADARDRCPDAAEDHDGFEDADGCPDPDDDGDGIPDAVDRCPRQAETVNGFDDDDGCPDAPAGGSQDEGGTPDRDDDGLPDAADRGPRESEGSDADGRPDAHRSPPHCAMREHIFDLPERVYFPAGSAQIPGRADAVLRDVADAMIQRRRVRVLVLGHGDGRGSAEARRRLGLRRAEAVRDALLASGVHPLQLAVSPARTAGVETASEAADRRVEFRVVRTDCPADDERFSDDHVRFDRDGDGQIDE